jgi:hypothetical protein
MKIFKDRFPQNNFSKSAQNAMFGTVIVEREERERISLNIPYNKNAHTCAEYNHFYLNKIERLSYFFRTVFCIFTSPQPLQRRGDVGHPESCGILFYPRHPSFGGAGGGN